LVGTPPFGKRGFIGVGRTEQRELAINEVKHFNGRSDIFER
jgi:hypothetical protein